MKANKETKADAFAVTTAPQDIARENSVSFDVYRKLRADIMTCKLKPNQRLRSDALRAEYGAAVGTLREALSHLVSDGLVRTEFGRGFSVAPVSVTDLLDVTEWRIDFEVRAIREAIRKGDDLWEAEIITAFHLYQKEPLPEFDAPAESWLLYSEKHQRFHNALVAGCGSPWLLYFRSALIAQAQRYQSLAYHRPDSGVYQGPKEHEVIMNAVMKRDEKLAGELIESHIRRTTDLVVAELSRSGAIDN